MGDQELENEGEKIRDPVEEAREDLIEKVSVAGWKEAFGEPIEWIAHCFKICLFILSGFCLYYVYQGMLAWKASGFSDEIQDIAHTESLTMSNVTVCAQLYANETFIRQNITIPDRVMRKFRTDTHNRTLDEFYRQLTLYMTPMSRPRTFDQEFLAYFAKVLKANPQIQDFSAFESTAMLSCESMFKRCWFDGSEFDCCEHAVQSIDDDGICYVFAVSFRTWVV